MKNEPRKPLMLAYIFFLAFSLLYHLISLWFNIDFKAWDSIIVAATIASYFFTIASSELFIVKLGQMAIKILNEGSYLLNKMEKEILESNDTDKITSFKNEKEEIEKQTLQMSRKINRARNMSFILQLTGYLAFFCILTIEWIFEFFNSAQDTYTLGAFILLLFIDYIDSTKLKHFEDKYQERFYAKNM